MLGRLRSISALDWAALREAWGLFSYSRVLPGHATAATRWIWRPVCVRACVRVWHCVCVKLMFPRRERRAHAFRDTLHFLFDVGPWVNKTHIWLATARRTGVPLCTRCEYLPTLIFSTLQPKRYVFCTSTADKILGNFVAQHVSSKIRFEKLLRVLHAIATLGCRNVKRLG